MDVTLPVWSEMTMVADVSLPSMTAREEARTVMCGRVVGVSEGGVVAGVG